MQALCQIKSELIHINKCCSGFQILFNNNDNFALRWAYWNTGQNNWYYGIKRKNSTVTDNDEVYARILAEMNITFSAISNDAKSDSDWPTYYWAGNTLSTYSIPRYFTDEEWISFSSPENSNFAESVIKIINKVYDNKTLLVLFSNK